MKPSLRPPIPHKSANQEIFFLLLMYFRTTHTCEKARSRGEFPHKSACWKSAPADTSRDATSACPHHVASCSAV